MQSLIQSLVRVALVEHGKPLAVAVRAELEAASVSAWSCAIRALEPHRIVPLIHDQLTRLDCLGLVPTRVRDDLSRAHETVRILNTMHILSTATLLRALSQRAETPLLMKGVVLADGYYADFSARPMGDIDVVAAPGRAAALFEVLDGLGYVQANGPVEADAVVLRSPSGVVCDAHSRLRLFEHVPWESLTRQTELSRLRGLQVRVFEPHAMVAHAIAHMTGHLDDLGPMLLWIIDVALIIRRHRPELSAVRVFSLLPHAEMRVLLRRVLALLAYQGERLSQDFSDACRGVPALSLSTILRQRRLTPWRLPAPIGWVRLCAHHLSLRAYDRSPVPELEDLLLWPVDAIANRVLRRVLGRGTA